MQRVFLAQTVVEILLRWKFVFFLAWQRDQRKRLPWLRKRTEAQKIETDGWMSYKKKIISEI